LVVPGSSRIPYIAENEELAGRMLKQQAKLVARIV
jgi:hypothetical protein